MPFVFNDPQHWLDRAAEARDIAARMKDLGARGEMLIIAEEYEKIAERAAVAAGHLKKEPIVAFPHFVVESSHPFVQVAGAAMARL